MTNAPNIASPPYESKKNTPQVMAISDSTTNRVSQLLEDQISEMKIQEIIKKKMKNLPINPDVLLGINHFRINIAKEKPAIRDEQEMKIFKEKIAKDSLLFTTILKIANSSLYGYSGSISTIQKAVFILGAKTLSEVILQAIYSKWFWQTDLSIYGIPDLKSFVEKSVAQLEFLESWDDPEVRAMLNELRTPVFLQEIGKIIIATIVTEDPRLHERFRKNLLETNNITMTERNVLPIDSIELTVRMFIQWKFPTSMIDYIRSSGWEPNSLNPPHINKGASILKVIRLLMPMYGDECAQHQVEEACSLVKQAGLNENIFMATIEKQTLKKTIAP